MNQAQHIIPRLKQLVELERTHGLLAKNKLSGAPIVAEIETVRALLPTSILRHHDARRARGKMSLARVTNGICGSCHLGIPRGRLADLRRVTDALNVCGQCGAFIYLDIEDEVPVPVEKAVRAKRIRKTTQTVDS